MGVGLLHEYLSRYTTMQKQWGIMEKKKFATKLFD